MTKQQIIQIIRMEGYTKSTILTFLQEEADSQGISLDVLLRRMQLNGFSIEKVEFNPEYTEKRVRELAMWSEHAIATI